MSEPVSRVRAFDDLTRRGQLGRLRALALDALRSYELEIAGCSFVSTGFNTVFRVDATNGSRYALRVSPALRIHAEECELVEAAWVGALRRDVGFAAPAVIPAANGSVVVWASLPGVPQARSCVLFEWVTGLPLRERVNADLVRETGVQTAVLHQHGATYRAPNSSGSSSGSSSGPPAGALVADQVLYFRTATRLDELRPAYGSAIEEALARAQRAVDGLWRNPPHPAHLLHGDIQTGNVMVDRGRVVIIDFQDLIWGFEIQDALITLIALRGLEHSAGVNVLVDAFRAGYETVRPWPESDPETDAGLRAARHLNILNFGLNLRGPGLDTFVARHAEPIVEWMRA